MKSKGYIVLLNVLILTPHHARESEKQTNKILTSYQIYTQHFDKRQKRKEIKTRHITPELWKKIHSKAKQLQNKKSKVK